MPVDADVLKRLVDYELDHLSDDRVKTHVRAQLAEPRAALRNWDYGEPGLQYPCWTILNDKKFEYWNCLLRKWLWAVAAVVGVLGAQRKRTALCEVHAWSLSEFVLLPIRIAAVAFVTLAFHTPSHDRAVVGPQHQPP